MGNINIELEKYLVLQLLSGDKLLNYFINDGESTLLFLAVENELDQIRQKFMKALKHLNTLKLMFRCS